MDGLGGEIWGDIRPVVRVLIGKLAIALLVLGFCGCVYAALRGLAMAGYPSEVISIFQVLDEIASVIVVAMTCMKLIIALYAALFK
jgi:hypothetical protein